MRRILTESLGRFPRRLRAEEDSLTSPFRLLAFPGLFSGSKAFIFEKRKRSNLRLSSCKINLFQRISFYAEVMTTGDDDGDDEVTR